MRKNPVFIILGILLGLNVLAWVAVYDLSRPQLLEVTFFDVGQGDAIFIETPERFQILIDGGPNSVILEKLGKEMPFWDRTIDLVILTHPEYDHMSGLIEVLKRYKVENILWTGVLRDTAEYKEWVRLVNEEGARIIIAQAPQKIDICYCEILYPIENLEGQEAKNSNDTSIVVKLIFGETSFLFTGDATKSVEKELVLRLAEHNEYKLNSDVLKVGHHGSKTSSSKEFINFVSPEIAVISVSGDNSYGHPHPEVLENLGGVYGEPGRTIEIFRTDLDGDIKIISNGTELSIF